MYRGICVDFAFNIDLFCICLLSYTLTAFYMGTNNAQWVDVFGLENIAIGSGLAGTSAGLSVVVLHPIAGE